ncbi:hypothetical protein HYC85_030624 [Camellia sinensis]|uniref:Uncharacterized protein n=1 Tax=Camellia sinensis TaxID=4442 RepID=A0A7J7G167_CAMSI|nr:hypothetical protein HYC85_030624 [Camellia sinensis]
MASTPGRWSSSLFPELFMLGIGELHHLQSPPVEADLRIGREGVLIADLSQSYPSSRAEATLVMTDAWPSVSSQDLDSLVQIKNRDTNRVRTVAGCRLNTRLRTLFSFQFQKSFCAQSAVSFSTFVQNRIGSFIKPQGLAVSLEYECISTLSVSLLQVRMAVQAALEGSVVLDPRATNHVYRCMMADESNCTAQYEMNAHENTTRPKLHHGSLRVAAASLASGLPNPLLCLASVCEPDSVFSVSFPKGRERSRRPSLSGHGLHFVAVGHFAHFGARFRFFGTVGRVSQGTENEAHFVLRVTECISIPQSLTLRITHDGVSSCCVFMCIHPILNCAFRLLGHHASQNEESATFRSLARFPRITAKQRLIGASRWISAQDNPDMHHPSEARQTPCLPSAIPERFAGGLSCQGMTIRLTGCGLCQVCPYRNACISLQVWASGLQTSGSPGTIASEGSGIPRLRWIRVVRLCQVKISVQGQISVPSLRPAMAQGSEEFVAMITILKQGIAMQDQTSAKTQRPSGASVSYPALGPQPNFDPLPPAEDLQGPNPREGLAQARVSTTLVQPIERLRLSDVNELDPTAVKIVNLEKQFKRAQDLNSIHDIEDWSTEVAVRLPIESTNAGGSTISKPAKINTVTIADPFAKASLQITSPARAQGRFFTPLHMSLTSAFKVLMERGHLKPLNPQPLPNPLPARHNPAKYCMYHQQRGHGTDRCYRLRHEVQNLIDNRTIAPPSDPNDQTSPAYLNLIHILPSTYDPSIYITPTHLPKPEVFIPESMDLCMMGAPEP